MNLADSERIAGAYEARGYSEARSLAEADIFVINTCSVRQSAEDRVYGLGKKVKQKDKNKNFKVVLTGCVAGRALNDKSGKQLKDLKKKMPWVDEFLSLEEVGFDYPSVRADKKHAWVPISIGCNNFCTYCVVPYSKGREVSRPFEDILKEVEQLARIGYKEVTLLGQNVNSYGKDFEIPDQNQKGNGSKTNFADLLEAVCKVSGLEKVHFLTSNPQDFSEQLIDLIAREKKLDRYIHLPIQSGNDVILARMNRKYTVAQYKDLVKKIRAKIPNVEFGTDVIVGFPGETKEQFENTVQTFKEIGFKVAYIGRYSPRPGTAAAKFFKDDVSKEEKKRRFHVLDDLVNKSRQKSKED